MVNKYTPYGAEDKGIFLVKNIAPSKKTLRIFQYPILFGETRDLLEIPGVSEADIRGSLLKGELRTKIRAREIIIVDSDVDLLAFNDEQKYFLKSAGVTEGLWVTANQLSILKKDDILLIGDVNDINTVFQIPSGKFIQNDLYKIVVYKNGVKQLFLDDYFIAESEGPNTGYDTIILIVAPTTTPAPVDVITADYYTDNT